MRQTACRVRSTSLLDRPERFVRLWSGFEATLAVQLCLNCYEECIRHYRTHSRAS
jgi:hypothetical protein